MTKLSTLLLCLIFFGLCISYSQNSKTKVSYYPNENWKVSTPEEQGVDSEKLLKMFESIQSTPTLDFHSILVVRNGHLITEAYWTPYNKNTTHNIKSASKSIISALVGIALDKKYLNSLDQKVSEFYPEYVIDSLKQTISLHDLLTMTGGLDWMEDAGPSPFDLESWNKTPMRDTSGEIFEYNTAMTHMMSAILTKATGVSTERFANKWLFKPLGITNYQWTKSNDGIYHGGFDIFLTPRDMAKFGYLYLRNGQWNEKQIVPNEWVKESTTKKVNIPVEVAYAEGLNYGYWWWIQEKGYMAWGSGGQYIIVNPDLDLVIVITATDGFDDINLYAKFMRQFLENYIYSAVISNAPIPAKPLILEKLTNRVKELENPKIAFEQMPKIAGVVSSKNYILDKNDIGFQSTSFIFSDSTCIWEYNIGGHPINLKVGLNGNYLINDIGYSMGVNPGGDKIACKGYWNSNEFTIEHHIIGDPTKQIFTFSFDGDEINMHLTTYGLDVTIKGIKEK
tara:strand:- start:1835 stop:3358 length:1524 start_codon:yes stop_codon:yes gene_type:complete